MGIGEVSLCDDCATIQGNGTPCGIMFSGDKISACNIHKKDTGKHGKLFEKYGQPKTERPKDDVKGVK